MIKHLDAPIDPPEFDEVSEKDKSDILIKIDSLISRGYLDPNRAHEAYTKLMRNKLEELDINTSDSSTGTI